MGRGRNRKPRNFATFRLCPRLGAADASDRVFVRVDDNPYAVPGFADDGGGGVGPSSSGSPAGGDDPHASSSSSVGDGGDALPEHVRREILELGLPDDGYDYLAHLRELRPSLSSTGGGGSSAVFLPARRPARSGLPADVKAYDLSRVPTGPVRVAEAAVAVTRVEEAIDLDVAKMLEEADSPAAETGDEEDLEGDFIIVANQPNEDEEDGRGEERAQQLTHEQFDSLALEEHTEDKYDCLIRDIEHGLSREVMDELKLPQNGNLFGDWPSVKEQFGRSSNAVPAYVGYSERYLDERRGQEQVVPVPESSGRSAVRYCDTTVSRSYLDVQSGKILPPENAEMKLPKFSPGEMSMKKAIMKKGIEKLPADHLPQRRTSIGETLKQGPYKEQREETKEN